MRCKYFKIFSILVFILFFNHICFSQNESKQIIELSWKSVINKSISDNLSLKSKVLDYESQSLEVTKSITSFLPSLTYQGLAINNLELPVFVFMNQRIQIGTNYNFQHQLQLNLPIFIGGSRWFNLNAQKSIKKSLSEELKGKEQQTVYDALESYFTIILTKSLIEAQNEAMQVAKANLDQVQKFYDAGTATLLDLQRAKAQYSATLTPLESAKNNKKLAEQNLKFLLNLSFQDSLIIRDTLKTISFSDEYTNQNLNELLQITKENQSALKAIKHRYNAVSEQKELALSQFLPIINLSGSVQHQAQLDDIGVNWRDYIRSKTITLSVSWPLFEGGQRLIEYQQAKVRIDQMDILVKETGMQINLNVEQSYYKYQEAIKNLNSLKETMLQAKESLRLANLLYSEGMSTQLDILNAQLFYVQSNVQYLQAIHNYNITQLSLLKAIGLLNTIWK